MKSSAVAHLVGWFLSSNGDTNITNERVAALWCGDIEHLFIKEEFLHGLGRKLNFRDCVILRK